MKLCSVPDCGAPYYSKGFCRTHYHRWTVHGDPLAGRQSPGVAQKYFDETVMSHTGDDCLLWPFNSHKGRAFLWLVGKKTSTPVTRLICERLYGLAPSAEHHAAHSCGNGHLGCVSPKHLSWKSPVENAADKKVHGTQNRGSNHGRAKLTEAIVRRVRAMPSDKAARNLAAELGVSGTALSLIWRRKNWAWLPD